jgi:hypothetical protein
VGRRCLFGVWEVPGVPGGRFFSKSQRWGTTAGPEQSSLRTESNWLRSSVPAAGGGQTMLIWSLGASRGPRRPIFLKISTIGNTAGPMQSSLGTELIWQRPSFPAAGSGQTMLIWSLGASRGLRRPIFPKISTIGNNRWPYAIVALNRPYMDIEGPPCGRRSADNAD